MALLAGFDANKVEPSKPMEAIPKGKYTGIIVDSEMKDTKSQNDDNQYLMLTGEIVVGEYKGRKLFVRLNLKNTNAQAVEIAERDLSAICRAVGVMTPKDSAELHGKPLTFLVGVKEYKGELKNEVNGFEPVGNGATAAAAPATAAGAEAPAAASSAPWA